MAVRASRPLSLVQDENAQHNTVSGGGPGNKGLGLKQQPHHQQQQTLHQQAERKKLSNITNQVHKSQLLTAKAAPSAGFSVKADPVSKPGLQDAFTKGIQDSSVKQKLSAATPRVPLKNISNEGIRQQDNAKFGSSELKPKIEQPVKLSPVCLRPEDTKNKAALWAEEGIEQVHFSGEEMEALQKKRQDEEIERRVAIAMSCRTDLPVARLLPPCDTSWEPPDVLELDCVSELCDDWHAGSEDWRSYEFDLEPFSYEDHILTGCSLPQVSKDWPKVKEEGF